MHLFSRIFFFIIKNCFFKKKKKEKIDDKNVAQTFLKVVRHRVFTRKNIFTSREQINGYSPKFALPSLEIASAT